MAHGACLKYDYLFDPDEGEDLKAALPSVKNILALDSKGKHVAVKYYTDDWPLLSSKLAFEKSVFTKTMKINARNEGSTILRSVFFVTGGDDENELILASVLQGFFDAVGTILRNNIEKKAALENLDLIYLCLDEVVDGGHFETYGEITNLYMPKDRIKGSIFLLLGNCLSLCLQKTHNKTKSMLHMMINANYKF
ncbi:coatomer subunit zeta-1-like [Carex rostrata]